MKITVATKWSELNKWQLQEIAYLFLTSKEYNFEQSYFEIIRILFQKHKGFFSKLKLTRLYSQVPYSTLAGFGSFLQGTPDLYKFPKIKKLTTPGPRLNNLTMKQFSVADAVFYEWRNTEDEIYLKQLVATLYTFNGNFSTLNLPSVARITDKIPLKKMYVIGLTYLSVRYSIFKKFPKVFPPQKKEADNEFVPQFRKNKYIPFSKTITAMAMDERQPLGNLKECNNTLMYDFLNTLEESIIRVEKENERLKKQH